MLSHKSGKAMASAGTIIVLGVAFFGSSPASAQGAPHGTLRERGAHYEIYHRGEGEYLYRTGGEVPLWTYDKDKGKHVPFVVKKNGARVDIRNGAVGLRIQGNTVQITDRSGEEIRVREEVWVLYRDGVAQESRLTGSDTVEYSTGVAHVRTYSTPAGNYELSYVFSEGKPLKQEVRFAAVVPGEYHLEQVWALPLEAMEEAYPVENEGPSKKHDFSKKNRVSKKDLKEKKDKPLMLSFKRGEKHQVTMETLGGDDFKGYSGDAANSEMRFIWGNWTLAAGETFLLDPIVYTDSGGSIGKNPMTNSGSGTACLSVQTLYYRPFVEVAASDNASGRCWRAALAWDTSIIPNAATVSSLVFKYGTHVDNARLTTIYPMTTQCLTSSDHSAIWTDAGDGTAYASFTPPVGDTNNQSLTLPAAARTALQNQLSTTDEFCIGVKLSDETRVPGMVYSTNFDNTAPTPSPTPTIEVIYSAAAPTFAWVSNSPSLVKGGDTETITSSGTLGTGGATLKMFVCKAADATSAGCGAGGTWCSVSGVTANPGCTFSAPLDDTTHNYYAYLFNNLNAAASNNPLSGTFTTDSTPPTTSTTSVALSTAAPYYDIANDSVTDIVVSGGAACRWYDSDAAYDTGSGNPCSSTPGSVLDLQNTATNEGDFASMGVPPDGKPVISWYSAGAADLAVIKCADPYCVSTSSHIVDSAGTVGQHTSLAIGSDGLPVISYIGSGLKVVKCGNAACNSGNTITTVDASAASNQTSIAMLPSGNPVISYNRAGALYVAKCGDTSCSSGNTLTPADAFNAVYNSIAVGADGLPFIGYGSGTAIKTAKCQNDACSAAIINTLDAAADDFVAVAVSTYTGRPLVVFQDDTGADGVINLAVCLDPACQSSTIRAISDTFPDSDKTPVAINTDRYLSPVISYCRAGIVVNVCADPDCSSFVYSGVVDSAPACSWNSRRISVGMLGGRPMAVYRGGAPDLNGYICNGPYCGGACAISNAAGEGSYTRYISCADALGNGQSAAQNLDVSWTNDFTPPSIAVSSISGDTSFPYLDMSTAPVSVVAVSGEAGMQCRIYSSPSTYQHHAGTACVTSGNMAQCGTETYGVKDHTRYIACRDAAGNLNTAAQNAPAAWCKFPVSAPVGGAPGWSWQGPDGLAPKGDPAAWSWQSPCAAGSTPYGAAVGWVWSSADTDGDGTNDTDDCAPLDPARWQVLTCGRDADGDGYTVGVLSRVCTGAACNSPAGYQAALNPVTYGTRYPSSGSSVVRSGSSSLNWTFTSNIYSSDDSRASLDTLSTGRYSRWLRGTGFGFTIPSSATVRGVLLEVEMRAQDPNEIGDSAMTLFLSGVEAGAAYSRPGYWPTSDTIFSYGGAGDLWGRAWTYSEVNDATFGAGVSVHQGGNMWANVDMMRITVYCDDTNDANPGVW